MQYRVAWKARDWWPRPEFSGGYSDCFDTIEEAQNELEKQRERRPLFTAWIEAMWGHPEER